MKKLIFKNKSAFTLTEILVTLVITSIFITSIFGAFKFFKMTVQKNTNHTQVLKKVEKAFATMSKDMTYGIQVKDLVSGDNSNNSICIAVPTLTSTKSIYTEDNGEDLGKFLDYIHFGLNEDNDLVKTIDVDPHNKFTAGTNLGRGLAGSTNIETLVKDVDFLYTFKEDVDTGAVTPLGSATLKSVEIIFIVIVVRKEISSGETIDKTIQYKIKLRNYKNIDLPVA